MIAVACARHLDTAGLVTFDEAGTAGDCFIGRMPDQPDTAVMVETLPGRPADTRMPHDSPNLHLLVRGQPDDPAGTHSAAREIFDHLHAQRQTTWDAAGADETRIVSCHAIQSDPVPLGRDDHGRYEYSLNFRLEVRRPATANRP